MLSHGSVRLKIANCPLFAGEFLPYPQAGRSPEKNADEIFIAIRMHFVTVITESIDTAFIGLCRRNSEIDFNYNLAIETSWMCHLRNQSLYKKGRRNV